MNRLNTLALLLFSGISAQNTHFADLSYDVKSYITSIAMHDPTNQTDTQLLEKALSLMHGEEPDSRLLHFYATLAKRQGITTLVAFQQLIDKQPDSVRQPLKKYFKESAQARIQSKLAFRAPTFLKKSNVEALLEDLERVGMKGEEDIKSALEYIVTQRGDLIGYDINFIKTSLAKTKSPIGKKVSLFLNNEDNQKFLNSLEAQVASLKLRQLLDNKDLTQHIEDVYKVLAAGADIRTRSSKGETFLEGVLKDRYKIARTVSHPRELKKEFIKLIRYFVEHDNQLSDSIIVYIINSKINDEEGNNFFKELCQKGKQFIIDSKQIATGYSKPFRRTLLRHAKEINYWDILKKTYKEAQGNILLARHVAANLNKVKIISGDVKAVRPKEATIEILLQDIIQDTEQENAMELLCLLICKEIITNADFSKFSPFLIQRLAQYIKNHRKVHNLYDLIGRYLSSFPFQKNTNQQIWYGCFMQQQAAGAHEQPMVDQRSAAPVADQDEVVYQAKRQRTMPEEYALPDLDTLLDFDALPESDVFEWLRTSEVIDQPSVAPIADQMDEQQLQQQARFVAQLTIPGYAQHIETESDNDADYDMMQE